MVQRAILKKPLRKQAWKKLTNVFKAGCSSCLMTAWSLVKEIRSKLGRAWKVCFKRETWAESRWACNRKEAWTDQLSKKNTFKRNNSHSLTAEITMQSWAAPEFPMTATFTVTSLCSLRFSAFSSSSTLSAFSAAVLYRATWPSSRIT